MSSTNRVLLERAGKLWSRRTRNPFPDEPWSEQHHGLQRQTAPVTGTVIDVTTDGLHFIQVSSK